MKSILLLFISCCLAGQTGEPGVVPVPQEYTFLRGLINVREGGLQVQSFLPEDKSISLILNEINNLSGGGTLKKKNGKKLILGLFQKDKTFEAICRTNNIKEDRRLGDEGYALNIGRNNIIIAANSPRGIFYGLQTLKQLVRGSSKGTIECVSITDFPSLKYRAVMDDVSRGPLPTLDFVKYQIRRLAEMKINMFLQYTEHIVKTKQHPEFAPEDGSYTMEELKELSDYASLYHITFVGGFQSFGHFNNILMTPRYAHLGESGTLISPVFPESYSFLKDIYSEMIPAFDSPFFHIDCDETFDLGKGASKQLVDSIGYENVYLNHILKLNDIVKHFGKRSMVWGDILLKYPQLIEKLPKDMVIGTWTYDELDSFDDFILPFTQAGLDVFVTPGVLNSYRLFPNLPQAVNNIRGFARDGKKNDAAGILTTVWDDGGSAFFNNDWYGVSFAADQSWNTREGGIDNFEHRLSSGIYASEGKDLMTALHTLDRIKNYLPTDDFTDRVFFEKIVPEPGKQSRILLSDWENVRAAAVRAAAQLTDSSQQQYGADRDAVLFTAKLYQWLADKRLILFRASERYKTSERLVSEKPFEARNAVAEVLSLIDSLSVQEEIIRNEYEQMWLQENHTYALDKITQKFDGEIETLNDIHRRVFSSLRQFDSGGGILPIAEVRLDIALLPGKYFCEWLMTNPIPAAGVLSSVDYLSAMGGELHAVPKVSEEHRYDSTTYRWRRVVSEYPDVVNLGEIFKGNADRSVVYAFATIESAADRSASVLAGCAGGIEVICNGKSIFKTAEQGKFTEDQFSFLLPLVKGKNNVMLKIRSAEGDFKFSFRLPDANVRNKKNRYKIIEN